MPKREPRGTLSTGYRRGIYKWLVGDVISLEIDEVVWSPEFEVGGFKWRLALFRGFRNGQAPELIRIFVFSCNDVGLHSDLLFVVFNKGQEIVRETERTPKTALPFNYIYKHDVRVEELLNQSAPSKVGEFMVKVDLKNIRAAKANELMTLRSSMHTVHVEVINQESIIKALSKGGSSCVVLPNRKRHCDVCNGSCVVLWAERDPDLRYWLCERAANGKLVIKRCMNTFDLFKRFEDVSDKSGGSFPWVTLFREEKKSDEEFQPIDDAIVVLCLLFDADQSDFSYLGHRVIQQTESCNELSNLISQMAEIQEGHPYKVFAEDTTGITNRQSSLNQCGVQSGCRMILRKLETASSSELENQRPTSDIQESGQNGDDGGHVHSSTEIVEPQPYGNVADSHEDMAEVARRREGKVFAVGNFSTKMYFVCAFVLFLSLYWVRLPMLDGFIEWWQKRNDQLSP